MDTYEISFAPEPPRRKRTPALVWNVLTILVLVTTLCVISVFLLIFVDPNSSLNPFPPSTLYPTLVPPTATVTPRITMVPSWTPTEANPGLVAYQQASQTPISTNTPGVTSMDIEPAVATPAGGFAFITQQSSPSQIAWTTFHPDAGCEWTGIAGQATSLNGEAVRGLFVQLGGSLPGTESIDKLTMTGLADEYGPGGFEFILASSLVATNGTLWIQLLDQQNLPISDRVYFETFNDCEKNLVIIYFDQVR
ncbi:MAG: hypothetical protein A2136_04645 [Chloroflexi bacterium RBG_16_54_11]|nr:MAG: hypothetical protein A2136_04645 [Chloroflexi bacterium RBG_16_54_11]